MEEYGFMIGFIVFLFVAIGVSCGVSVYRNKLMETARNSVVSQSRRYRFLKDLSCNFQSHYLSPCYTYTTDVKTRAQVDRIDARKNMIGKIKNNSTIVDLIRKGCENEKSLVKFDELLNDMPPCAVVGSPTRLGKAYMKAERQMTEQLENDIRPVVPKFCLTILYVSPAGRSTHSRDVMFTLSDMLDLLRQMKKEAEYKQSAKYQRSQVTETVRYNVMRRDGFRCTICGRDASDGVKLHVDHIIPVSKGGKSTMDNLRTLCEECNRGKRDKDDKNGPN